MPSFIDQYISQITTKSARFADCFSKEPRDDAERTLAEALSSRWRPLPSGPALPPRRTFAVDGASGSRPLDNGATLLVAQSLLLGPETEETIVCVEMARGTDSRNADRLVDHIRQWCEAEVAAANLDRMAGGMLLIDGSLLADLKHILTMPPMRMAHGTDLRAELMGSFLRLIEGCRERDILLVGVAKTTKDDLLHEALVPDSDPTGRLSDMELLYRFGGGEPGYTSPILYGTNAIQLQDRDGSTRARAEALPCVAVSFVRLAGGEDPLRIDVMGYGIGRAETLLAFHREWGSGAEMEDVVLRLMALYGGASVYNAPLYQVDRLVRLSGITMDGAYMALLREATGEPVNADRGTRRFTRSR